MAKLVDALGLGPSGATLESSSLSVRTMINFLHNFNPQALMLDLGLFQLNWYGFFVSLAMLAGLLITFQLRPKNLISQEKLLDLIFWLIVVGLLGARLYDVLLELPFYIKHPLQIFQIWKGGLAIHGGILAGLVFLILFSKKEALNFWKITAILTPGLALGQAIGRFGNYFNQELFGRPTNLPWGIPIELANRPLDFISYTHFHPTFLYESLGSFFIFIILFILIKKLLKTNENKKIIFSSSIVATYMLLYSILRFSLEFIRIDYAPNLIGLRVPQITSLLIIMFAIVILIKNYVSKKKTLPT